MSKDNTVGTRHRVLLVPVLLLLVLLAGGLVTARAEVGHSSTEPLADFHVFLPIAPRTEWVDLTIWHPWQNEEAAALSDAIAAFRASQPWVQVDAQYVPFEDLRAQFSTAVANGQGPTLLIGAADWGPGLYEEGLVADVSPLASAGLLDTINEAALGAVQYDGALIGLPETIKGVTLYRNPSIIAEPVDSYQELVAAAQAAAGGGVEGADLERGFFFAAAHLHGMGGQLMDAAGCPAFNDQTGVDWVNLLDSFDDAGPTEYYTEDDVNLFMSGQAGFIIDGTWNMMRLANAVGAANIAIDPWPTPLSGYVQTENIYMNADVTGYEQTIGWAFMEYFLSIEAQEIMLGAGHLPAVEGVTIADPLMEQAVEALAGGTEFPVIFQMGAYWGPMDAALHSVYDDGADPAQALQEAYDAIVTNLGDMGYSCGD